MKNTEILSLSEIWNLFSMDSIKITDPIIPVRKVIAMGVFET